MKKILGLTIAALLVMALVGGGTWAYFSDPEQTDTNVLTAGVLDLTRDSLSGNTTAFFTASVDNVSPGDSGSESTLLKNTAGTLTGELDINLGDVSEVGGTTGEFGLGDTDLGGKLYVAIWLDKDDLGSWNADDVGLGPTGKYPYVAGVIATNTADSGTITSLTDTALDQGGDDTYWVGFKVTLTSGTMSGLEGVVTAFDDSTDTLTVTEFPIAISTETYDIEGPLYNTMLSYHSLGKYDAVLTMAIDGDAGDDWNFVVEWLIPATVDNTIQGDTAQFVSIVFTLEQAAAD